MPQFLWRQFFEREERSNGQNPLWGLWRPQRVGIGLLCTPSAAVRTTVRTVPSFVRLSKEDRQSFVRFIKKDRHSFVRTGYYSIVGSSVLHSRWRSLADLCFFGPLWGSWPRQRRPELSEDPSGAGAGPAPAPLGRL